MADRDVETRAGVGAALSSTNYDQTIKSLDGTVEEQTGATYEVVYTDQNKTIELNHATMTCTLDAIADIAALIDTDQFKVTLRNTNAATATVQRSSTDTIDDGSATSITLLQYETVTLQFDSGGSNWNIIHTGRVIGSGTINEILDVNGNELLEFGTEASAANNIKVWNKAGTAYPRISAEGAADTGIVFNDSNGNRLFLMDTVNTSADNYVYTNNNAGAVTVGAQGADTNIDLNLTPKGSGVVAIAQGDLEVGSTPVYGLVVLDTPVQLETGTATVGTWTQHDMSAGNGSAAATAGASKAILRAHVTVTDTAAGVAADTAVYAQKNSLGGAIDLTNMICSCRSAKDGGDTVDDSGRSTAECIVNLDSNSDFEFQVASGGGSLFYDIYLVGYYV